MSAGSIALDRYRRRTKAATRRFATPGALARYCEPGTLQTPALDLIDQAAVDVMDGVVTKQQLAAPPQIGKSQRISRWTPFWMLLCDPTQHIVIVSADLELARRWGRQIRRDIRRHPELGLRLQADSQAAHRWETTEGGSLTCVGISAGTTGLPITVLIIDDPIKDRAQAESKTQRERIWDYWENDGGARAQKTILMATRWHKDDLAGRLQEKEPGQWSVLSISAIAENADDPLGRTPGEEIQSANPKLHPPGYYANRQKNVSPYVWSSVYQQRPTAAEGGIFKRGDWRYWTLSSEPHGPTTARFLHLERDRYNVADCHRFCTIDLATSTKTSADFTVAAAWAITPSGDLVLLDRVRERVPETDHAALLAPLRQRWLGPYDVVHIESRMFGTTLVYGLGRAGVPVAELEADTDKLTRALAGAGLVRQHRIWLPAGADWLDTWLDEHADFPNVAHDDQVDNTAYAARVAIAHWLPPETHEQSEQWRTPARDPEYVDLMTANW